MAQKQNPILVNPLQSSPLFHLSLTSKELFHSNFLYWLGVTYRDLFKETFSNLGCRTAAWPEGWTVEREYKAAKSISLDLCVKGPGKNGKIYLILENKVKSIPNQQQLNRYTSYWERDNEKPCFVLLSLMTDFPDKDQIDASSGGKWIVWNYGDLAAALDKALTSCGGNVRPFHKEIIEDYIQLVEELHRLFGNLTVNDNDRYYDNVSQVYANLRMDDVYEKVRASSIVEKLAERLRDRLGKESHIAIESGYKIEKIGEQSELFFTKVYVDSGFTRGMGLVEAKVKINDRYVLAVQIQGEQYRHAIEWFNFNTEQDQWTQTQKEKLPSGWFTSAAYVKQPDGRTKDHCKYVDNKKSNSIFLYRYRKIKDNETVDNVLNEVVDDICHIFQTYGSALTTQPVQP